MNNVAPNSRLASSHTLFSILTLSLVMAVPTLAAVTPEIQRVTRGATFEVVLKKPTPDPVSYEKPLPLELLPFVERTDLYRSVGTAFAVEKNTYVTAAHVLMAAIGSQYGAPALRASDGTVHPIGSSCETNSATCRGSAEEAVLTAESALKAVLAGGPPDDTWAQRAKALAAAYASERRRITRALRSDAAPMYHPRQSPCSVAAQTTSGKETPVIGPIEHSLDEFYPPALARKSVEGLVVLSVRVNAAGCVTEAAVVGSSGSDEFDTAALRWVETASYLPAEHAGTAIGSTTRVAVDFKLRD